MNKELVEELIRLTECDRREDNEEHERKKCDH